MFLQGVQPCSLVFVILSLVALLVILSQVAIKKSRTGRKKPAGTQQAAEEQQGLSLVDVIAVATVGETLKSFLPKEDVLSLRLVNPALCAEVNVCSCAFLTCKILPVQCNGFHNRLKFLQCCNAGRQIHRQGDTQIPWVGRLNHF
jgi:uncharacterized MAPEG superfamily protein